MDKDNAIILAAGMGRRLSPMTEEIPKPLIKVKGIPIIERQILYLNEIGINDIFIVIGYKATSFEYLVERYGVRLIYNPYYDLYNNIYSFYLCREFLGCSYILDGDSFLINNFLKPGLTRSTYFTGEKQRIKGDWVLKFKDNLLNEIVILNDHYLDTSCKDFIMSGVSFWTTKDTNIIRILLDTIFDRNGRFNTAEDGGKYWDCIVYENLDKFEIFIEQISTSDWYEIDTLNDLEIVTSAIL